MKKGKMNELKGALSGGVVCVCVCVRARTSRNGGGELVGLDPEHRNYTTTIEEESETRAVSVSRFTYLPACLPN